MLGYVRLSSLLISIFKTENPINIKARDLKQTMYGGKVTKMLDM